MSNNLMLEILNCQRCKLFQHQKPLLDNKIEGDVLWLGLSAKKVTNELFNIPSPLDKTTNSGSLINVVEENFQEISFYKNNLVKCVPLDENNKLRYPNKNEMERCYPNFRIEMQKITPKLIFLLGNKVAEFVLKEKIELPKVQKQYSYQVCIMENYNYIPIHHPSYIYIYKRK